MFLSGFGRLIGLRARVMFRDIMCFVWSSCLSK